MSVVVLPSSPAEMRISCRSSVTPSPSKSERMLRLRPSAAVVVVERSRSEPSALRVSTVRIRSPSLLIVVMSEMTESYPPSPFSSMEVVFESPSALPETLTSPSKDPSGASALVTVVVEPSALVVKISLWSAVPSPSWSIVVVTVRPPAPVVVVVRSRSEPSALKLLTARCLLPPASVVISIRCERSKVPLPSSSNCVNVDCPSALLVIRLRKARRPSGE